MSYRVQRVVTSSMKSGWRPVISSVPQGVDTGFQYSATSS